MVTACAIGPSEKHVCLCCYDGSIRLYTSFRLAMNVSTREMKSYTGKPEQSKQQTTKFKHLSVNKLVGKYDPFVCKFHPLGGMILVGLTNSQSSKHELCFFDTGLNIIKVMLPNGELWDSIDSAHLLGRYAYIKTAGFLNSEDPKDLCQQIFVVFDR